MMDHVRKPLCVCVPRARERESQRTRGSLPPFIVTRRGGAHEWKSSFSPESRGCSGRTLWEVHCGAWRRAWQSSWVSSLTLRRSRRRLANPSRRRGRRCRMFSPPDVAFSGPCRSGSCVLQRWRGTRRSRTPQDGVLACTSGGSGDTWRSRTTRGGGPGLQLRVLCVPLGGHVASPDPFPSRRWVRGHTCDEVESGRPELAE